MVIERILQPDGKATDLVVPIPTLDQVWKYWGKERKTVCYHSVDIIRDYLSQGIPLGVRQVAYLLEVQHVIHKTKKTFKKVGTWLTDLRKRGVIPIHTFEDQTRATMLNDREFMTWQDHWRYIHDQFINVADNYELPRWYHQPFHVEVWCEARGVAATLSAVCQRHGINLKPLGGQDSVSEKWNAIERLQHIEVDGGSIGDARAKKIVILYIGDHDPSGIQIEETARNDLTANKWTINIGGRAYRNQTVEIDTFKRIAITLDQIEDMDIEANPTPIKRNDSNRKKYIERFGMTKTWEADAIEPRLLARIVEAEISRYWSSDAEIDREQNQNIARAELRDQKEQFLNQYRM